MLPTMASSHHSVLYLSLLLLHHQTQPTLSQPSTTLLTNPSANTFILAEESTNSLTNINGGLISLTSNVPVTISRYNDNTYKDGEQPFFPNDARLIVTSDCSTSDTDAIPTINWAEDGGVTVNVPDANSITAYLTPASYEASWSWNNWDCNIFPTQAPFTFDDDTVDPSFIITGVGAPTKRPTSSPTREPTKEPTVGAAPVPAEPTPAAEEGSDPFNEKGYAAQDASAAHPLRARSVCHLAGTALMGLFRPSSSSPSSSAPRNLQQQCTYNVELLIDGCTHPLEITAPQARIVDAVLQNSVSTPGTGDETCTYDYTTDITFPINDGDNVEELSIDLGTIQVEPLAYGQCVRAVDGRPFVDASGSSLMAMPFLAVHNNADDGDGESASSCNGVGVVSWSGDVSLMNKENDDGTTIANNNMTTSNNNNNNSKYINHHLAEEWTQRALGEHASIASFSAFSIALLTNRAPSSLVQDALLAGLDEVRHARTSFEIASLFGGRDVGPGPLPSSTHEFGEDLTALALAVAREGCVDETLSALVVALEVEELKKYSDNGELVVKDGKYANVDAKLTSRIQRELHTIAMEESNHSALAWRTLFWVCSVDSEACNAVKKEVLEEKKLEARFQHRFGGALSNYTPALLDMMRREWKMIYETFADLVGKPLSMETRGLICDKQVSSIRDNQSVLSSLTENIIRGVLCHTTLS